MSDISEALKNIKIDIKYDLRVRMRNHARSAIEDLIPDYGVFSDAVFNKVQEDMNLSSKLEDRDARDAEDEVLSNRMNDICSDLYSRFKAMTCKTFRHETPREVREDEES